MLTLERHTALIDVPRNLWDPTEVRRHSRYGERSLAEIRGLEVHWDGTPGDLTDHFDTPDELLSFERFHEQTKGWYDLFYNYGGDVQGFVYEGRNITIPSQRSLRNWATFLCVTGTNTITPEEELVLARSIFRAWTTVDPSRNPNTLRGHGERDSTSCPGPQMLAIVNRLRAGWIPEGTNMSDTPEDITTIKQLHDEGTAPEWAADAVAWAMLNDQITDGSADKDAPVTELRFLTMLHRAAGVVLASVPEGRDGEDGEDGADGISPSVEDIVPAVIAQLELPEGSEIDEDALVQRITAAVRREVNNTEFVVSHSGVLRLED